jgi:TPR repeat protein
MARLVRCIEGHVFDVQTSPLCPVCGAIVEVTSAEIGASGVPEASAHGASATSPVLWAVAGVGLVLILIAAVVVVRFELMPASPTADTGAKVAEQAKIEKPQTQAQKSPSKAQEDQAAMNTDTADASPPKQLQANAPPPPPANEQMQSGDANDQNDQSNLQPSDGQRSGGLKVPAPASSTPIDGEAFKTSFADVLSKLGSLAPIDPLLANIATGIAGLNLFNHGEEQAGQSMLKAASAANISFAATALGQQFFGGTKTLRQDYEQARKWFEIASHTGDVPVANYELSVIYARGLSVQPDLKLAGHYFLSAYHGGFQPVVEIVAAARAGQKPQRALLHKLGLDADTMGMTILDYYNARRASDPNGAREAIDQLASGFQWPAANILAMAQWNGDYGTPDRTAAVKNFLVAASGGAFSALVPIAEASLDDTLGSPNPVQASVAAVLMQLYSGQISAPDGERLRRVSQNALDKAGQEQRTLLFRLRDLLSQIAPAQAQANNSGEPAPVAGR